MNKPAKNDKPKREVTTRTLPNPHFTAKEMRAALDFVDKGPTSRTHRDACGNVFVMPPVEVRKILAKLPIGTKRLSIGSKNQKTLFADNEIATLQDYAAQLFGSADCKLRAVFGCGSCPSTFFSRASGGPKEKLICEYERLYNRFVTDCGERCVYCRTEFLGCS